MDSSIFGSILGSPYFGKLQYDPLVPLVLTRKLPRHYYCPQYSTPPPAAPAAVVAAAPGF